MPTIEKRLGILEERYMRDSKKNKVYEVVVFKLLDTPEEHERKIRQIAEIEESGGEVFAVHIVGGMEKVNRLIAEI
ncbi:MAG: hypothetical protein C0406_06450 [Sideroxydans sp.]|nr:hypothetical protein [Sideroxydans sp.]